MIAAAGGVVLGEANRAALRASGAHVVWLRADPDVLGRAGGTGDHRPCSTTTRRAPCAGCWNEREPLYREVADVGDRRRRAGRPRRWSTPSSLPSTTSRRVTVALGERSYDVVVGHGAVERAAHDAPAVGTPGGDRVAGRHPVRRRPRYADAALRDR